MKLHPFIAGALCALGVVAASSAMIRRAQAAEPSPARVQLISDLRDTEVYVVEYDQHACFIASTKGGSGVSITCAH